MKTMTIQPRPLDADCGKCLSCWYNVGLDVDDSEERTCWLFSTHFTPKTVPDDSDENGAECPDHRQWMPLAVAVGDWPDANEPPMKESGALLIPDPALFGCRCWRSVEGRSF